MVLFFQQLEDEQMLQEETAEKNPLLPVSGVLLQLQLFQQQTTGQLTLIHIITAGKQIYFYLTDTIPSQIKSLCVLNTKGTRRKVTFGSVEVCGWKTWQRDDENIFQVTK